jgi:beta-lactam-binding protein with PASTA domain
MRSALRPPDVVGYTLEEARDLLSASGWPVGDVVETRPPRGSLLAPYRVVRQRVTSPGQVALVICGERSADARV